MEELVQQILESAPYIGVFIVLMLTGLGLPVPEDVPLLISGYLCHQGLANLWIMLALTLVSVLGSDAGLFWMGRRWGHHVTRFPMLRHVLSESALLRAEKAFHKHGGKTLFVMRFVPGVRAAAFFTAGTFKLPFWKLLVFDGAAALISVPTWVLLGYFFGDNIDMVKNWGREASGLIGIALAVAVALYLAWHFWRKRKAAQQTRIVKPQSDKVAG